MADTFASVLGSLASVEPTSDDGPLFDLSDLDRSQLDQFQAVWSRLPDARRLELLERLGTLARDHMELSFERIDRLALEDPSPEVRRRAIENLWESEDPSLVEPLQAALQKDLHPGVRRAAAAGLGQFVYLGEVGRLDPEHVAHLEAALLAACREDPDAGVRLRSLESLGYSSRPEVSAFIERAFQSNEEDSRKSALLAMGRSANDRWRAQVSSELDSPSPSLRLEAARAAGELEIREAASDLIELLEDVDGDVRRAAIWSLGQLGGPRARRALTQLVESSDVVEETSLLEDALDHLAFVDGSLDLAILDLEEEEYDEETEEELEDQREETGEDELGEEEDVVGEGEAEAEEETD